MTTRKPLSLEEARDVLAELDSRIDNVTIPKIIESVRKQTADEQAVRQLLAEFCERAKDVRKQFPISNTPDLIEFVAERLALFLCGQEPDLLRSLGLKRPDTLTGKRRRGRKPKKENKDRAVLVAAMVMERMASGETLDVAAEAVAKAENINDSTARDHYSENLQAARMLLVYRYLLSSKASHSP